MRLLTLVSFATLLLAGCTGPTGAVGTARHQRGDLNWGLAGLVDVPTLDPALASDPASITVCSMVYRGLVGLDSRLRIRPDGASRWSISPDGRTYTFFLRRNLRYPDGRLVTSKDFVLALNRALGPQGSSGTAAFYLGLIAKKAGPIGPAWDITAPSPFMVRIGLDHPSAHFLSELAFPASYVPDPRVLARYGASWTDHATGFGPFSLHQWKHSKYLQLRRNRYFYGGAPPLRRISLRLYSQAQSAIERYQGGELDLVSNLSPGTAPPRLDGTRTVSALALDYLAFNTGRPPFERFETRAALAAAVRPAVVGGALGRSARPWSRLLPSGFNLGVPAWKATMSARAYFKRAGFGKDNPFPRTVLAVPRDPELALLATNLKNAWRRELGIDVTVRQLNPSNYAAVMNTRVFTLGIVRWGGDYPDPQNFLETQLGSGSNNVTGWSDPSYNRTLARAESYAPDDVRRLALFRRAATIASQQLPLLPLDEPVISALIAPSLTGITLTPLGTITAAWHKAAFKG